MAIKRKAQSATIKSRELTQFNPETFDQYKQPQFIECNAQFVLDNVRPIEFDFLPGVQLIAVDTETYSYPGISSNRMPPNVVRRWIKRSGNNYIPNDFPFCISISDGEHSFVVYDTLENHFDEFKKLAPLFNDTSISKMGHNLGFDLHMLANAGVDLKGRLYDTSYMSRLTRGDALLHSLLTVADEIYEPEEYPTVTIFEHMLDSYKAANRVTDYRNFPKALMTQYTCADVWNTIYSFKYMYPKLIEYDLLKLFNIESQMLIVSYYMERTGVKINRDYKDVLIPELTKECDDAERKIYDTAGCVFNINSGQQLYNVLAKLGYGHLVTMKPPTEAMMAKGVFEGNPCFDKGEMDRLDAEDVPLIKDIMAYRNAEKLLNTFAIKLYELCDSADIVHCGINTMEAKTGRFSISVPSMQNMPRRKDSRIRDAFIARDGCTLYDFDFKAQESLIMAHYSRAPYLLENINAGKDIHKVIAAIIYNCEFDAVTKPLRNVAKSIEFAIVYGAGASKVKSMTSDVVIDGKKGLTLEEAQLAIRTFKKRVPEVDIFIKVANEVAKDRGYIKTTMGRRVYTEKGREYACVNYLCQGSAADSTKGRMVSIYKFLKANHMYTQMILQVHDSLLNQVDNRDDPKIVNYLRWLQTERELFRVQVNVDVAICTPTWRNKEDIDVDSIEPPKEMLEAMENYDIWKDGILCPVNL